MQLVGSAAFNMVNISRCNFTKNSAHIGGGLSINMRWKAHNNLVVIEHSTIDGNSCPQKTGYQSGGGAHLSYDYETGSAQVDVSTCVDETSPAKDNQFLVHDVLFRENCAELGGGSTFFFSSRSQHTDINNTITFQTVLGPRILLTLVLLWMSLRTQMKGLDGDFYQCLYLSTVVSLRTK